MTAFVLHAGRSVNAGMANMHTNACRRVWERYTTRSPQDHACMASIDTCVHACRTAWHGIAFRHAARPRLSSRRCFVQHNHTNGNECVGAGHAWLRSARTQSRRDDSHLGPWPQHPQASPPWRQYAASKPWSRRPSRCAPSTQPG